MLGTKSRPYCAGHCTNALYEMTAILNNLVCVTPSLLKSAKTLFQVKTLDIKAGF